MFPSKPAMLNHVDPFVGVFHFQTKPWVPAKPPLPWMDSNPALGLGQLCAAALWLPITGDSRGDEARNLRLDLQSINFSYLVGSPVEPLRRRWR